MLGGSKDGRVCLPRGRRRKEVQVSQSLPLRCYRRRCFRWPQGFFRGSLALGCLLVFVAFAGCGGNTLKNAADEAVKGTAFEVKSVSKTGDNAGTAVAETDDGSRIEIDLSHVKDAGEFVLDSCQNLRDAGYDCTDLDDFTQP